MLGDIAIIEQIPWFSYALGICLAINFILAFIIIFLERKEPSATLAWIMVLYMLPFVGMMLYVFFSQNIAKKKIFKLTRDEEEIITNSLVKQSTKINNGNYNFVNEEADKWKDLIRLNQVYGRAYFTQDNEIEVFTNGEEKFEALFADIKKAKESINMLYFIVKPDYVGKRLIGELTKKAREGVRVKLLLDALGSKNIGGKLIRRFKDAGGEFATFFPPKVPFLKMINPTFNYRNHRKLVIIDDKVGYIGGINVAKEYMGEKKKFGYWRDTHIKIRGGSVLDLNGRFTLDWRFASSEKVNAYELFYAPEEAMGRTGIQIVSSGPDSTKHEVKRAFMKMITSASKNVYIQTPYFIPDTSILESIKMAAQSGVDVRIMIPSIPDHIFVYWATYSYVAEIINSGGRVYVYDKGFLHSKTMMVDGEVATVGSTNFDRRSFNLNFESNAFIYDGAAVKNLEAIFKKDMEECHQLTKEIYDRRSFLVKVKEPISRLLSDIL